MTTCALLLGWFLTDVQPGDAYRLPPVEYIREGYRFNRKFRIALEKQLAKGLVPPSDAHWMMSKAEEAYRVWDYAEGAHPDYRCHPHTKAYYLRNLRMVIGREAYMRGELPPCVPHYLFQDIGRQ